MTWFVVAAIIGFGLFRLWQANRQRIVWPGRRAKLPVKGSGGREARPAQKVNSALIVAGAIVFVLIVWAVANADCWCVSYIADRLGSAQIARFLLGLLLGAGSAYILGQRQADLAAARTGNSYATPWGLADWTAGLSAALVVTLLAVFAPNIDNWLTRLSSLKASVIEFQLQRAGSYHVAVADNMETSSSFGALHLLTIYSEAIENNLTYLQEVARHVSQDKVVQDNLSNEITQTERMAKVFKDMIAPTATCVQNLIYKGLNIDYVKQEIRPVAQKLEKIVSIIHAGLMPSEKLHKEFWKSFREFPGNLANDDVDPDETHHHCLDIRYSTNYANHDEFPRMEENKETPYLFVASALLMHFVQDDDNAYNILKDNQTKTKPDNFYWKLLSRFAYFQGRKTDDLVTPLEQWHDQMSAHIKNIYKYCKQHQNSGEEKECSREEKEKLTDHELEEEFVMMNNYEGLCMRVR